MDSNPAKSLSDQESVAAVSKRLGKQAAFAAISIATLSIGKTPQAPTSVYPPYNGIKDIFTTKFRKNMPPHAIELLDALEKISRSTLDCSTPSSSVVEFIERIESADPMVPDIDEDNTNIGWGHSQFTSGGITCTSVLQSWSDISNMKTTYHLLVASLKTGLVARHLCFVNNILVPSSSSYLSDAYLCNVVEILWNFQAQDLISTPLVAAAKPTAVAAAATLEASATGSPTKPALTMTSHKPQELNERSKWLECLHANELKTWMSKHLIPLPPHSK